MKKIHCCLFIIPMIWASCSYPAAAQKFEFIPFAGYQTGAKITSWEGVFHLKGGMDFGAAMDFGSQSYKFELSYSRMVSNLTYTANNATNPVCDLAVTYASIGGVADIYRGDVIVPYAKIALGGTFYNPTKSKVTNEYVMHFDISGGVKFRITDHFGLRIQASLLLPIFFEGMLFQETTPPPGEGMSTKVSGVQGNFTGGLIIRF